MSILCILPPYLLQHLAEHGDNQARRIAVATLEHDHSIRARRALTVVGPSSDSVRRQDDRAVERAIYDVHNGSTITSAKLVRSEGAKPTGNAEVDEAYDGLGDTYDLYEQVFKRNSIDGKGLELKGYVHYQKQYDNAFWDGKEMIFGDGDGTIFNRFTISVDVIGHELTHGVTQYESNLDYNGQSGALNESVSDCFGSLVKQYKLKQSADKADWLIGAGLLKNKKDLALRSMKAPGTAYNDDELGKDPQPKDMSGYVDTTDDNGGVHTNSGIPNRAFYEASIAIGGNAWEGAGAVWYDALTNGTLKADADFKTFADATVESAVKVHGEAGAKAVSGAWKIVGVL